MATIRVRKTKDFSIVSNVLLRDKRLSLRARGLLVFMLSLSDTWEYSITGLANATGESTGKISTCLKELESFGYLTRERIRNAKGQMDGTEYTLRESPVSEKPDEEKPMQEKPSVENPTLEKPALEKPSVENRAQYNTKYNKYQDKEELNTHKNKNNARACDGESKVKLQPIPFKSPAQIDREKRAVVGSAPPYTQEQRAIAEEYFNQFWAEYPKKQGQVEARLAWMRQNYSIETYIAIIKAVERFKQIRRDWQTEGGRYVPLPENFLIKERWKDEVKAETVQFDRPMDIALMAGMIMAEEKKNADERGHNIRMDGMARSRTDITAGGEHRTVSDNEPFDVPAVWTP